MAVKNNNTHSRKPFRCKLVSQLSQSFVHNCKWSRVNNVRSSEHDLTRAFFIFREHERQKPSIVFRVFSNKMSGHRSINGHFFTSLSCERNKWITSNTTTRVSTQIYPLRPLYPTPGVLLAQVESPQRVTLLQSNVYKRLHENSSLAESAPLAG